MLAAGTFACAPARHDILDDREACVAAGCARACGGHIGMLGEPRLSRETVRLWSPPAACPSGRRRDAPWAIRRRCVQRPVGGEWRARGLSAAAVRCVGGRPALRGSACGCVCCAEATGGGPFPVARPAPGRPLPAPQWCVPLMAARCWQTRCVRTPRGRALRVAQPPSATCACQHLAPRAPRAAPSSPPRPGRRSPCGRRPHMHRPHIHRSRLSRRESPCLVRCPHVPSPHLCGRFMRPSVLLPLCSPSRPSPSLLFLTHTRTPHCEPRCGPRCRLPLLVARPSLRRRSP